MYLVLLQDDAGWGQVPHLDTCTSSCEYFWCLHWDTCCAPIGDELRLCCGAHWLHQYVWQCDQRWYYNAQHTTQGVYAFITRWFQKPCCDCGSWVCLLPQSLQGVPRGVDWDCVSVSWSRGGVVWWVHVLRARSAWLWLSYYWACNMDPLITAVCSIALWYASLGLLTILW